MGAWCLSHWATREVPHLLSLLGTIAVAGRGTLLCHMHPIHLQALSHSLPVEKPESSLILWMFFCSDLEPKEKWSLSRNGPASIPASHRPPISGSLACLGIVPSEGADGLRLLELSSFPIPPASLSQRLSTESSWPRVPLRSGRPGNLAIPEIFNNRHMETLQHQHGSCQPGKWVLTSWQEWCQESSALSLCGLGACVWGARISISRTHLHWWFHKHTDS